MNGKNSIKIKICEKELYHIFKDLEKFGRTTFSYPDVEKHRGIARSIGIRAKPLVKKNLIIPPLSSTNSHRMTGIMLPPNVEITEKKDAGGFRFYFQRKK